MPVDQFKMYEIFAESLSPGDQKKLLNESLFSQVQLLEDCLNEREQKSNFLPDPLKSLTVRRDAILRHTSKMISLLKRLIYTKPINNFYSMPLRVQSKLDATHIMVTSPGLMIFHAIIRSQGGWKLFEFHDLESAYQAYESAKKSILSHLPEYDTVNKAAFIRAAVILAKVVRSLVLTQNIIRGIYSDQKEVLLICSKNNSGSENNANPTISNDNLALAKTCQIFGQDWEDLVPVDDVHKIHSIHTVKIRSMAVMSACRQRRSVKDEDIEVRCNHIIDSAIKTETSWSSYEAQGRLGQCKLVFLSNSKLLDFSISKHEKVLNLLLSKLTTDCPAITADFRWVVLPKFKTVDACEKFVKGLPAKPDWRFSEEDYSKNKVQSSVLEKADVQLAGVDLTIEQVFDIHFSKKPKGTEFNDQFDSIVKDLEKGSFISVPLVEDVLECFAKAQPDCFLKVHLYRLNRGEAASKIPDRSFVLPNDIAGKEELDFLHNIALDFNLKFQKTREILWESEETDPWRKGYESTGAKFLTKMVEANNQKDLLLVGYAAAKIINFAIAHGDDQLKFEIIGSDQAKQKWEEAIEWAADKNKHPIFYNYITQFNSSPPVMFGNPSSKSPVNCSIAAKPVFFKRLLTFFKHGRSSLSAVFLPSDNKNGTKKASGFRFKKPASAKMGDNSLLIGIDIGGTVIKIEAFKYNSAKEEIYPIAGSLFSMSTKKDQGKYKSVAEFCKRIITRYRDFIQNKPNHPVFDFQNLVGIGLAWPGAIKSTETSTYVAATSQILGNFEFIGNPFRDDLLKEIHTIQLVKNLEAVLEKELGINCLIRLINDGVAHIFGHQEHLIELNDKRKLALIAGTGTAIGVYNKGDTEPDTKVLSEGGKYTIKIQYPFDANYPAGLTRALFSRHMFETIVADDLQFCHLNRPPLESLVVEKLWQNKTNLSKACFTKVELDKMGNSRIAMQESLEYWKNHLTAGKVGDVESLLDEASNNLADIIATIVRLHTTRIVSIGGGPVSGDLGKVMRDRAAERLRKVYGYIIKEEKKDLPSRKRSLAFPIPRKSRKDPKLEKANTGCLGAARAACKLIEEQIYKCLFYQLLNEVEEKKTAAFSWLAAEESVLDRLVGELEERRDELGIALRYDNDGKLETIDKVPIVSARD